MCREKKYKKNKVFSINFDFFIKTLKLVDSMNFYYEFFWKLRIVLLKF